MSASHEIFERLRTDAYDYARVGLRMDDGRLDQVGLVQRLISTVFTVRHEGKWSELTDEMARDTIRNIAAWFARQPGRKAFSANNRALWEWLLPRTKAEALRLARLPEAKGRVDRFALRQYVMAQIEAYRAQPGMSHDDDDFEGVFERQTGWFARLTLSKAERLAPGCRRSAMTRQARNQLRFAVQCEVELDTVSLNSTAPRLDGRSIRTRVQWLPDGSPRTRRERTGRRSAAQIHAALVAERESDRGEYARQIARAEFYGRAAPAQPPDLGIRLTLSAVQAALVRLIGRPERETRIECLDPNVRDLADYLHSILPAWTVAAYRLDDLCAKMWPSSAKLAPVHRHRVKKLIAAVIAASVGIHARIEGDNIVYVRANRSVPNDLKAFRKRKIKVRDLPEGLMPSRRHGGLHTKPGQEAMLLGRALTGRSGKVEGGCAVAAPPEDVATILRLLGGDLRLMRRLQNDGVYRDSVAGWAEVLESSADGDLLNELLKAAQEGGYAGAWQHLTTAEPYQRMIGRTREGGETRDWREVSRVERLLAVVDTLSEDPDDFTGIWNSQRFLNDLAAGRVEFSLTGSGGGDGAGRRRRQSPSDGRRPAWMTVRKPPAVDVSDFTAPRPAPTVPSQSRRVPLGRPVPAGARRVAVAQPFDPAPLFTHLRRR